MVKKRVAQFWGRGWEEFSIFPQFSYPEIKISKKDIAELLIL
jgi:hypothetical protein